MASWKKWIQDVAVNTAVKLVDPERDERVTRLALAVQHAMSQQRNSFNWLSSCSTLGITVEDRPRVASATYRNIFLKIWKAWDATGFNPESAYKSHRQVLAWASKSLQIDAEAARQVEYEIGLPEFHQALRAATSGGDVRIDQVARLRGIVACLDARLPDFLRQHGAPVVHGFVRDGFRRLTAHGSYSPEALELAMTSAALLDVSREYYLTIVRPLALDWLVTVFSDITQEPNLDPQHWSQLVQLTHFFGLDLADLHRRIQPIAVKLVEQTLADAKADEVLSDSEEQRLSFMLETLQLPAPFHAYVQHELGELRLLTEISNGCLPLIKAPRTFALKSGELSHYHGPATWLTVKHYKSGARYFRHAGVVLITDTRLLFASDSENLDIRHAKVLALDVCDGVVDLRTPQTKSTGRLLFGNQSRIASAIYETAVGRYNQTITERSEAVNSRHIPRDVRQRVWQRYGGRCAECNADDYLEFDHIVPVARGGSNSETNVQLLCRRCNLAKSDKI